MLSTDRIGIRWAEMGSDKARDLVRKRSLPRGHIPVGTIGQNEKVFELWLQNAIWIGQYVYFHDASYLPTDDVLDAFIEGHLGLEPWSSSATEEEVSGMKVMFARYRTQDPQARLSVDEAIRAFTIPFWIKGDRHWVAGPRSRPGVLDDPHGSMIRHLIVDSHAKRARGWQLTLAEQLYGRVGEILAHIEAEDPRYLTLPTYRKLIGEYNARHPGAEVDCLHR
jgi:hypothetical protein